MMCGGLSSALQQRGDSQAQGSGIMGLPFCFWKATAAVNGPTAGLEHCSGCPGVARINAQPSTHLLQLSPAQDCWRWLCFSVLGKPAPLQGTAPSGTTVSLAGLSACPLLIPQG